MPWSLLRCCRDSVPARHAPRPGRAFGTTSSTHDPAPGRVSFRARAASPGRSLVNASEEESPGCCDHLPIGHSEHSEHSEQLEAYRSVVAFLQGVPPQQCLRASPTPRPMLRKHVVPRTLAGRGGPLPPSTLLSLPNLVGSMTPLCRPPHQRCVGVSVTAVLAALRQRSVTVSTYPPDDFGKGRGQASRPRESALPSRLCGDPSKHAGAATGTRTRHRLLLSGLPESRACPHSISRALQPCRPGVAHSAL